MSACSVGDLGSIPGSGRSPGEGNGNQLQYSYWRIPWTEEPGGLQSTGWQRIGHEHSFMCLLAISMSSSVQCFFMSFLYFLIVLLLWSFESSLYSLDTNSFFDTCFINIFSCVFLFSYSY